MRCAALWSLALLSLTACGMAERDDEDRKSYDYLRFTDEQFESYCLQHFDTNGDNRLSRYEAESVRTIDCRGLGIRSLSEIEAFIRLEELDCSQNEIEWLDLTQNEELRTLSCHTNRLTHLALGHLRGLKELSCHANLLTSLNLDYTTSLTHLDCRDNRFTVLDLRACSTALQADARLNPSLSTIYCRSGQQVNYEAPAVVVGQ